jgi:hypothetical protein
MQAAFPTADEAGKFLERVVGVFNACVRCGDFTALVNLFDDDAVLDFEGIPERGPVAGKAAIKQHFRFDPPDDEIRVTRWKWDRGHIYARFVWQDIPEAMGGCVDIEPREEKIARLTLAFGGPAARWR